MPKYKLIDKDGYLEASDNNLTYYDKYIKNNNDILYVVVEDHLIQEDQQLYLDKAGDVMIGDNCVAEAEELRQFFKEVTAWDGKEPFKIGMSVSLGGSLSDNVKATVVYKDEHGSCIFRGSDGALYSKLKVKDYTVVRPPKCPIKEAWIEEAIRKFHTGGTTQPLEVCLERIYDWINESGRI